VTGSSTTSATPPSVPEVYDASSHETRCWPYSTLQSNTESHHHWMNWIRLCSVLRPRQHSIGYMGDSFYRSKDPTNSIKVLKEQIVHRQLKHTISRHEHEQFLDGTSAQLGYTVPFTSVYAGKYMTEDKSKTDISTQKTQQNPEKKQTTQNRAKQN